MTLSDNTHIKEEMVRVANLLRNEIFGLDFDKSIELSYKIDAIYEKEVTRDS